MDPLKTVFAFPVHSFTALLLALVLAVLAPQPACAESPWVRPCDTDTTAPRWGHRHGLQVGLPSFPRGLVYLYMVPVVKANHVLNFIAIEPIVDGVRGYSELEPSDLDPDKKGKRFWSADELDFELRDPAQLACGTVTKFGTTESLQLYIMSEPFHNGAKVYLRLTFHSDKPGELHLETFAAPGSAKMSHCILTATMGNYARLRRLYLANTMVTSHELWPDYKDAAFAPTKEFELERLHRRPDGSLFVPSLPDELDPTLQTAPGHWNYQGLPAVQYWVLDEDEIVPGTLARVNGRYTYWMSEKPIPGGISFENFELRRPFRNGESATYGVTTNTLVLDFIPR